MNQLIELYTNHPYWSTLITGLLVSTAVGALPSPTYTSSPFYRWFFDFTHAFTGGLFRIIATRNPAFQPTSGAQPYRPENANGSTAKEIKEDLKVKADIIENIDKPWKPKGAK